MSTKQLRKVMGLGDLVMFYAVTVLSLRWIATAAAAGPSSILMWILGCVTYFIPVLFCVFELSSRYPEEGGIYLWTRRAFGDFPAFMTGWLYWAATLVYFPSLLYFAAGNALFIGGDRWQHLANNSTYFITFSLAGLLLGFVLNTIGLDFGKWLHNFGAIGTWVPALILIVMGAVTWLQFGSATKITAVSLMPTPDLKSLIFWSIIAFAFGGVESASLMGEEIQDPLRNIPRALLASGIFITLIYVVATVSLLAALPAEDVTGLQGFMQGIARVSGRIGGVGLVVPFVAFLVAMSSVGGVSAWFATCARLPFVAGIDRFLPPAFARVHPRWHTPYVSLAVQAVISAVFIFLGQAGTSVKGAYDVLVSMGVVSYFLPLFYLFAAVIRVQRQPAGPGVMRIPGGKPVAIFMASLGLLTTVVSAILACLPSGDEPNKLLAITKILGSNALLVAIGAVIYAIGKSARSA